MEDLILKPLDQLFLLNLEIHKNLDKIAEPILVVGGQAVAYWLEMYSDIIEMNAKDEFASQSVDIDYATCTNNAQLMADFWGVDVKFAKNHPPPSIAVMKLVDYSHNIKKNDDGFLFIDIDEYNNERKLEGNMVDIIDLPAGFSNELRSNTKYAKLYSSPFIFPESFKIEPSTKLRILSPLGCLKSRITNLLDTPKNNEIEIIRIKLLREPLAYYLQDVAEEEGFREYKRHLDSLKDLILSREGIQLYTLYDVNLIEVYRLIAISTPDTPNSFIDKELPSVLKKMNEKYTNRKAAYNKYLSQIK
ncbi:hypothetical protein [uncultured Psychromonas sp.]|uniref:hypothetical protein n=1 Tax=uncultured Psychromonas sp. TaxID=173974 RepID=UPI002616A287|nr:hypothetical protein [uncultured Psychromonas sp.]